MPSTIHEAFLGSITKDIDTQLSAISESNHSAAALARQIDHLCSSTIRLEDGSTHNPDSQYKHRAAQYPGVAIEVAYSQSKKEGGKILSKLADQYIVESSGGIKLVICINLEYRGTKKATISTWSPKYIKDQGEEYLVASETMGSQVWKLKDLCLHVTDESRNFERKMDPALHKMFFGSNSSILYRRNLKFPRRL